MNQQSLTPQARLKEAQDLVNQAAERLHEILSWMAASLIPFPYFLGSTDVQAIEAEAGGIQRADRGCIVVCADGEMYEFSVKLGAPDGAGFGMERTDSLKPVTLPPQEYIAHALHAVQEIATLLAEQEGRAKKYSF